jgi:hypothetical protein
MSKFPHIQTNASQLWTQSTTGGIQNLTSTKAVYLLDLAIPSVPSATYNLMGASAGSAICSIQVLNTGRIRFNTFCGRMDTPTGLMNGVNHTYLLVVDSSLPSAQGMQLYIDYVPAVGFVQGTYTQNASANWASVTTTQQFMGSANTPNPQSLVFGTLILWPGQWTNLSDPTNLDKFRAEYIGLNAERPFSVTPPVFLLGKATTWNTGNPNRGSGQAWAKNSGGANVTDADTNQWPPKLTLTAQVLTPGPHPVGSPIDILLSPNGIVFSPFTVTVASTFAGSFSPSATVTMVENSNGVVVTFTPTEQDKHTLSFTNNGGHDNPVDIAFDVGTPYVNVTKGQSVVLTKAQAATLQIVTVGAPAGTTKDIPLRWRRKIANTGQLTGINLKTTT